MARLPPLFAVLLLLASNVLCNAEEDIVVNGVRIESDNLEGESERAVEGELKPLKQEALEQLAAVRLCEAAHRDKCWIGAFDALTELDNRQRYLTLLEHCNGNKGLLNYCEQGGPNGGAKCEDIGDVFDPSNAVNREIPSAELRQHLMLYMSCVDKLTAAQKGAPSPFMGILRSVLLPRPLFLAQQLRDAMKGDVRVLLEIASTEGLRQLRQVGAISAALGYPELSDVPSSLVQYQSSSRRVGREVEEFLRQRLHGTAKERASTMLPDNKNAQSKAQIDAIKADAQALHGDNWEVEVIIERSESRLKNVKAAFRELYGIELTGFIKESSALNGPMKEILTGILDRDQNARVGPEADPEKAKQQAFELFKAGEAKLGTEEAKFIQILARESPEQLKLVNESYQERSIEWAIRKNFSGEKLGEFLEIVRVVLGGPSREEYEMLKSRRREAPNQKTNLELAKTQAEKLFQAGEGRKIGRNAARFSDILEKQPLDQLKLVFQEYAKRKEFRLQKTIHAEFNSPEEAPQKEALLLLVYRARTIEKYPEEPILPIGQMLSAVESDAAAIHNALGQKDKDTLIWLLVVRNSEQLREIRAVYRELYGHPLDQDIRKRTGLGSRMLTKVAIETAKVDFERLLLALAAAEREEGEDYRVDDRKAKEDAIKLYDGGIGKLGTDEALFIDMFTRQHVRQLARVFDWYDQLNEHSVEEALANEFSGDILKALLAILAFARDGPIGMDKVLEKQKEDADKQLLRRFMNKYKGIYRPVNGKELAQFQGFINECEEETENSGFCLKQDAKGVMDTVEQNAAKRERMEKYFSGRIQTALENRFWKADRERDSRDLHRILASRFQHDLTQIMRGVDRLEVAQTIGKKEKWHLSLHRFIVMGDKRYAHAMKRLLHLENAMQITKYDEFLANYGTIVHQFMDSVYRGDFTFDVTLGDEDESGKKGETRLMVKVTRQTHREEDGTNVAANNVDKPIDGDAESDAPKRNRLSDSDFLSDLLDTMSQDLIDRLNVMFVKLVKNLAKGKVDVYEFELDRNASATLNGNEQSAVGQQTQESLGNLDTNEKNIAETLLKAHLGVFTELFWSKFCALAIAFQRVAKRPDEPFVSEEGTSESLAFGIDVEESAWPTHLANERVERRKSFEAELDLSLEEILGSHNYGVEATVHGRLTRRHCQIGLTVLQKLGYFEEGDSLRETMVREMESMLEEMDNEISKNQDDYFAIEQLHFTDRQLSLYAETKEELSYAQRAIQKLFYWLCKIVEKTHKRALTKRNRFKRFFFGKLHAYVSQLRGLFTGKTPPFKFLFRTFFGLVYYGGKYGWKLLKKIGELAKKVWNYLKRKVDLKRRMMRPTKAQLEYRISAMEAFKELDVPFNNLKEQSVIVENAKSGSTDWSTLEAATAEFGEINSADEQMTEKAVFGTLFSCMEAPEEPQQNGQQQPSPGRVKREAGVAPLFVDEQAIRKKRRGGGGGARGGGARSSGKSSAGGGSTGNGKSGGVATGGGGHDAGGTVGGTGTGKSNGAVAGGAPSGKSSTTNTYYYGSSGKGTKTTATGKTSKRRAAKSHKALYMAVWTAGNVVWAFFVTYPFSVGLWHVNCDSEGLLEGVKHAVGDVFSFKRNLAIGHLKKLYKKVTSKDRRKKRGLFTGEKCGHSLSVLAVLTHVLVYVIGVIAIYSGPW